MMSLESIMLGTSLFLILLYICIAVAVVIAAKYSGKNPRNTLITLGILLVIGLIGMAYIYFDATS